MLITQAEAHRITGKSKATIGKWAKKDPRPGFFVEDGGKLKIDTDHPEWKKKIQE